MATVNDYWHQKCQALDNVPRLADIDLMDIYLSAPYIFIADRHADRNAEAGQIYRWRYWGTALRDFTGVEATGKWLHETHEPLGAAEATADYEAVLTELRPSDWKRNVRTLAEDRSYLIYERIVFPLRDADGKPNHVLGVLTTDTPGYAATRAGEHLSRTKIGLYEDSDGSLTLRL